MNVIKLFDTVALHQASPGHGLSAGAVGTVVELSDDAHVEVEFSDLDGASCAEIALPALELLRLHHTPMSRAA